MTSMMAPTTAQHILDLWGKRPLDFDPGTQWQYSNTNYVIAGRIRGAGQRHGPDRPAGEADLLAVRHGERLRHGCQPIAVNRSHGLRALRPGPPRPSPQEGAGWMFAAGELAMPAHDLALWDISLIDRSLLPPPYTQMFTPVLLKNGDNSGYGLGVFLKRRDGHMMIEHSGEVRDSSRRTSSSLATGRPS